MGFRVPLGARPLRHGRDLRLLLSGRPISDYGGAIAMVAGLGGQRATAETTRRRPQARQGGQPVMTRTTELRAAITGLIGLAATEEKCGGQRGGAIPRRARPGDPHGRLQHGLRAGSS